jgi:magnesium-transporting ATPase (P-type)
MFESDPITGLTAVEAVVRLREFGANEVPAGESRGLIKIIADTVKEPMLLLLIAASAIYLLLGDLREGIFLVLLAIIDVSSWSISHAAPLFQFSQPPNSFLMLALASAAVVVLASETTKSIRRYAHADTIRRGK